MVVLLTTNNRRSSLATQVKLDEVDPVEEHNRLEELDEPEILKFRK